MLNHADADDEIERAGRNGKFQRVGLADEVLKSVIPMRGRMLHEPDGSLAFQYYSSNHTDAIVMAARILREAGFSEGELRMMFVTNPAKVDQSWNNVALGIQGVTLIVTTPDPNVNYKQVGWTHCFFAGSRVATVAGGESVTFTANVVGLLGRTASIGLDVPACG